MIEDFTTWAEADPKLTKLIQTVMSKQAWSYSELCDLHTHGDLSVESLQRYFLPERTCEEIICAKALKNILPTLLEAIRQRDKIKIVGSKQ